MRTRSQVVILAAALTLGAVTARADGPTSSASGGGWIITNTGGKASFAFFAEVDADGALNGHLTYRNHDTGLRVTSTTITSFSFISSTCIALFEGPANGNAGPVLFTVAAGHEAGAGDTFSIHVTGVAGVVFDHQSGFLQAGNFQGQGRPEC